MDGTSSAGIGSVGSNETQTQANLPVSAGTVLGASPSTTTSRPLPSSSPPSRGSDHHSASLSLCPSLSHRATRIEKKQRNRPPPCQDGPPLRHSHARLAALPPPGHPRAGPPRRRPAPAVPVPGFPLQPQQRQQQQRRPAVAEHQRRRRRAAAAAPELVQEGVGERGRRQDGPLLGSRHEVGARPRRHLRLCSPRREALVHAELCPYLHRSHLDPVVPHHQAQELPPRRRQLLPRPRRHRPAHPHRHVRVRKEEDARRRRRGREAGRQGQRQGLDAPLTDNPSLNPTAL